MIFHSTVFYYSFRTWQLAPVSLTQTHTRHYTHLLLSARSGMCVWWVTWRPREDCGSFWSRPAVRCSEVSSLHIWPFSPARKRPWAESFSTCWRSLFSDCLCHKLHLTSEKIYCPRCTTPDRSPPETASQHPCVTKDKHTHTTVTHTGIHGKGLGSLTVLVKLSKITFYIIHYRPFLYFVLGLNSVRKDVHITLTSALWSQQQMAHQ